MVKVLGIQPTSFTAKDTGKVVTGIYLHVGQDIPAEKGRGVSVERLFVSSAKLETLSFELAVGQQIDLLYNRWGKIAGARLLREAIDDDDFI